MNRAVIRAFSIGLLLATAIIGTVYYSQPHTLTKSQLNSELNDQGLVAIPKKEYEHLKEMSKRSKQPSSPSPAMSSQLKTVHIYRLVIKKGDVPAQFAKELEAAQIIPSAKAFMNYLEQHQLTHEIRIGTYEVRSDMSYENIGNIITGKIN
ncbi:aminodeoxychorismate lyase [Thermaerobacillus caldiproteolyticus]|uniref:aminodeoxychorismate lyase n=1 Tax=Thermaerobacillus caldiproteolyticus TaxID=247480 RepID=UPI00188B65C1|nr:aminodeoxychorismate lyase [Anoxybacillus caldiproteolyticus]QPA30080.1 aminodeoxychorismate lyase [Anoxybacillus caldiproteolyticus]